MVFVTHYVLVLHRDFDKLALYIMADAIDYYERPKGCSTWIYLRGGNAVNVFETPEEISTMLKRNTGAISSTDTRSEQERWLYGE